MEDSIISTHKLLVHSGDYKRANALSVFYIFIVFIISLGIWILLERLKSSGIEFADNTLPGVFYYIIPGVTVIFAMVLIVSPVSLMRAFYIDVIDICQNGIRLTSLKKNEQKFFTFDKFTLTPASGKKTGKKGFVISIKKETLKRSLYFFSDFENPEELEENLKKVQKL